MEGHCSTGQSPQWAVVPMEEEEVNTSRMVLFLEGVLQKSFGAWTGLSLLRLRKNGGLLLTS